MTTPMTTPASATATARPAAACGVVSVLLLAGVAAMGDSAAVPGLGRATALPPWDAALHPVSGLVTVLLVAGYGAGAAAVWLGLLALRRDGDRDKDGDRDGDRGRDRGRDQGWGWGCGWGWAGFEPRRVAVAGVAAVALLVVVPPLGSADHLSYAAYGRIAGAGDDPYLVPPDQWRDGRDPVAGAVQPPWRSTPSVYGPVGTAVQAAVAAAGGGSLRLTVWLWQLVAGTAFLATGALLHRLARHDRAAAARVAVMWTLNPLLLGQLVLGAHVDVLAVAFAVAALSLVARAPLAAGILLGAAVGTKAPYALVGLAACWGLRRLPRPSAVRHVAWGAFGSLAVLVPAHLWAGPHVFDQLSRAGRMVSLATPWRPLVDGAGLLIGAQTARVVVGPVALALAVLVAVRLGRALAGLPAAPRDPVTADAVRAAVVLAAAWVLTAPYALPWYDAVVWAPLALLAPSWLDAVMLVRLTVLAVAYVPGRVVGMSPLVERGTLAVRSIVAPLANLAVLVAVLRLTRRPRDGSAGGRGAAAGGAGGGVGGGLRRRRLRAGRRRPVPAP